MLFEILKTIIFIEKSRRVLLHFCKNNKKEKKINDIMLKKSITIIIIVGITLNKKPN